MKPAHKTAFLSILLSPGIRIYTDKLPIALKDKYAGLGLRGGDILIAAFTEFCYADILITEDENFNVLKEAINVPFKILSYQQLKERGRL